MQSLTLMRSEEVRIGGEPRNGRNPSQLPLRIPKGDYRFLNGLSGAPPNSTLLPERAHFVVIGALLNGHVFGPQVGDGPINKTVGLEPINSRASLNKLLFP